MATNGQGIEPVLLDDIINCLLEFRNARTVRQVQLSENEIRALCTASREIFLSQPNHLELEAPIKICDLYKGLWSAATFLVAFSTFSQISFAAKEVDLAEWKGDILDIGVTAKDLVKYEKSKFKNAILQKLDTKLGGLLSEISSQEDFTGKAGQSFMIINLL